ncbi:unnamed protein product [Chironomus riparius]|uniref:non-specific protein-tyrosine kinase n=1 Tax=Chironomus riparius TaxID=315576 RepID=A0A9P0NFX4_9DIPT|nr:unnamed protein product [Chironomus riparius]
MDEKQNLPDLYEFLVEAELQQYYTSLKNELKITAIHQIKYATDQDFRTIGFSRPEIRRLHKFYDKYCSQGYLSKIKRLLQTPVVNKRDELINHNATLDVMKVPSSPNKLPTNKHIIPLDSISVNKQLGNGEFGIVQQGVWTNGNERIQVAIKCLCRERMQSNPMEFLKEAAIMHSIDHENIVRLYGVVLSTDSLMLVTELAPLRSLLECLKDNDLRVKFLTVPVLCDFALQICNGMMYLENNRFVHRDLACRNILVFNKNKVKISDFGLSRALGVGKDYYKTNFNVNLKLPIAWCSAECVNYLKFTSASDVWAYGVCLWEMFSYGFQPWPAFTGQQILEAIDKPNFQRLEKPEVCPKEYYALMLKCWSHEPHDRPKFVEIYRLLPDMKPEQLKTVTQCIDLKKEHLAYRQGDIITVLDKATNSPYWLGVLHNGRCGLFNPANTVAHIESLPSSSSNGIQNQNSTGSFIRNTLERNSKRKLKTDMISSPQNDFKHTGHVGIDGAYFGNVAFLSNTQTYNKLPRQVVTPYKPSEDLEQLLPPTPTSIQTNGSTYFSESTNLLPAHQVSDNHRHLHQSNGNLNNDSLSSDFQRITSSTRPVSAAFNDSNPFAQSDHQMWTTEMGKNFSSLPTEQKLWDTQDSHEPHDYHEISDDEMQNKVFDFGPSLLDEMDFMFRSMSTSGGDSSHGPPLTPNFDNVNKRNELTELNSKLSRKNSSSGVTAAATYKSKKKASTVKLISVKDEKMLNQAIEFANEMSARSMTDLDQNQSTQSPKRKFSFRFPHMSHSANNERDGSSLTNHLNGNAFTQQQNMNYKDRKNFSEVAKNAPDLQSSITAENSLAYKSLVEDPKELLFMNSMETHDETFEDDYKEKGSTLPRVANGPLEHVPQSNKAATLSKLLRITKDFDTSTSSSTSSTSSPLKALRDKSFPIVKPRLRILPSIGSESVNSTTFLLDHDCENPCETPSYMANADGNFSLSVDSLKTTPNAEVKPIEHKTENPLPLPPRDRSTLQLNIAQKRHVRKYPLIIPASATQRTLDKVNQITPVEDKSEIFTEASNFKAPTTSSTVNTSYDINNDDDDDDDVFENLKKDTKISQEFEENVNNYGMIKGLEKNYTKDFIENNFPSTSFQDLRMPSSVTNEARTYQNIEDFQKRFSSHEQSDTASLHFESILEDENVVNDAQISDDMVDGFGLFESENSGNNNNKASSRNNCASKVINNHCNSSSSFPFKRVERKPFSVSTSSIESKKNEFSQKFPKYKMPKNELASNALFNKIKESVEMAANSDECEIELEMENQDNSGGNSPCELKRSINHVSCEDLLDFSDKKPLGAARGLDSDEARILRKMFGTKVTLERCLDTLNFINWDLQKAIKLCKMQNMNPEKTLQECFDELDPDWDLDLNSVTN